VTYTRPTQACRFRKILSDLAKYSMTQNLARSLCDSRVSCSWLSSPLVTLRQMPVQAYAISFVHLPILTCDTPTDAYSRRVVPFEG